MSLPMEAAICLFCEEADDQCIPCKMNDGTVYHLCIPCCKKKAAAMKKKSRKTGKDASKEA